MGLEAGLQFAGVDEIIFDGIAGTQHFGVLEPGNGLQELLLHILRQRSGDAVGIDGVVVQALRFEENLMALAAGEPDHLVLDGWAIARPGAGDLARIHRRQVKVFFDQGVAGRGRAGDVAADLRRLDAVGQIGKRHRRIVAGLFGQRPPVDGAAVEPGRGAGLQPPEGEPQPLEGIGQPHCRLVADAPGWNLVGADMDQAAQERPGGDDDGPGADVLAAGGPDPGDGAVAAEDQVLDRIGQDVEARLIVQQALDRLFVKLAVGLGAGALDRRPLGAVENAELNPGLVDGPAHDAVQGIDLAHQLSLGQAADGRVAGHLADGLDAVGQQQGAGAQPRRRGGGFAAGVAAADDDDVVCFCRRRHGPEFRVGAESSQFPQRAACTVSRETLS